MFGRLPVCRALAVAAAMVLVLAPLTAGVALAVQPGEALSDPGLEARARSLSAGLRCLVCQNQSIDDSGAPLAKDLRVLVRERISAGDSDDEVTAYVVARYGEFVLLKPPLGVHTLLLWLMPLIALAIAAWAVWRSREFSTGNEAPAALSPLSPKEEKKLRDVLGSQDQS